MKKKAIAIGIIIIIILIGLYLYYELGIFGKPDEERFLGTWIEINKETGAPTQATFYKNSTFYGGYWPIGKIWELEDGKILMSLDIGKEPYATYYYEFQEDDTILKLTNLKLDKTYTFQKQ
jgi:hypothetical protein